MLCTLLLQVAKQSNLKWAEGEKKHVPLNYNVSVLRLSQNHPNLRPERKLKMTYSKYLPVLISNDVNLLIFTCIHAVL